MAIVRVVIGIIIWILVFTGIVILISDFCHYRKTEQEERRIKNW